MHVDLICRSLQFGIKAVLVWILNGWMLIISQCGKREGVYKSRPALPSALLTINKDTRSTLTEWHTMAIPYELLSLISTKKLSRQFLGLHDTTETYFRSN